MKIKALFLSLLLILANGAHAREAEPDTVAAVPAGQRIVEITLSLGFNASVTEILKHSVHATRPDGTARNSFPSRHTSWAFTASTVLSNEFYRTAPWVSVASHAAATAMGMQRVISGAHYGGDVAAGATIGILSTEGAYALTRLLFRRPMAPATGSSDFAGSLYVTSETLITGGKYCTGFGGTVGAVVPLTERWGIAANLTGAAANMRHHGNATATFAWATVGGVYSLPLAPVWEMQASLAVGGGARKLCRMDGRTSAIFVFRPDLRLIWHLTPRFAAGITAGYVAAGSLSAASVGVSSNLLF